MDLVVTVEEMKKYVTELELSHKDISDLLQNQNPRVRGLSASSVKRFCASHRIHKDGVKLSSAELDRLVLHTVNEVGPTYGRKMLTGKLRSDGYRVGHNRVADSLRRVTPVYTYHRSSNTAKLLNPVPYQADYFGHKAHIDQNEKLIMYGVTHVAVSDGYSGLIARFSTMPIKNNLTIYGDIFRPLIVEYGLFDQLRVDEGREFYLTRHVQEMLSNYRGNLSRRPVVASTSTKNHPAERVWGEVNPRVNFPIKAALNAMVNSDILDMTDNAIKYCTSWFTSHVATIGTMRCVRSWNDHTIPRKGIPSLLMRRNNGSVQLPIWQVPTTEQAVRTYESLGGRLTEYTPFGEDPLKNHPELQTVRLGGFQRRVPSFESIFNSTVNHRYQLFTHGLQEYIRLTLEIAENR